MGLRPVPGGSTVDAVLDQLREQVVRRGDGTYVRSAADPRPLVRRMEHATLREVFEVQLAYDVQAARLAARRRTTPASTWA